MSTKKARGALDKDRKAKKRIVVPPDMVIRVGNTNKRLLPHVRDHTRRAHQGNAPTTKWPEGLRIPSELRVRKRTDTLAPRAKEGTKEENKARRYYPLEVIHMGQEVHPHRRWSSFCYHHLPKPSAPSARGRERYGGGGRTAGA